MILRTWSARATRENAVRYREHFDAHVRPALRSLDGYLGATVLERDAGGMRQITVMTRWRSMDAVRRFAGPNVEVAVVADEAVPLFEDWDRDVQHHEVVFEDLKSL